MIEHVELVVKSVELAFSAYLKALGDIISNSDGLLSRITWFMNWYMYICWWLLYE